MPEFVATLLKVEDSHLVRSELVEGTDGKEFVNVERTFGSNPEEAVVRIEAKDMKAARARALEILDADDGLPWRSYRDTELWGKNLKLVVDIVSADEHMSRSGEGNIRGSEDQATHEARLRAAVKE